MKIETLKVLVENILDRNNVDPDVKTEIMIMFGLYGNEMESPLTNQSYDSEKVPFYEICGCNPKNGGSGICGCTNANKMVNRNGNNTWYSTTTGNLTQQHIIQTTNELKINTDSNIGFYTEDEVMLLLNSQRANCYVAVYNKTLNQDMARIVYSAPEPGQWKKSLKKNNKK